MELRPYQVDCVNQLRDGYRQGFRRQLLTSPTGSGKTVLFSFITKSSADKGQRTVIMAHRSEILRQISETLDTVGVPHKVLRAGMATPRLAQTVVASVNTLSRRLDGFPPPDLCVVDECFPAGTMISTPTGEVPIEQIKPGDSVVSFQPLNGKFSAKTVTATMQRQSSWLVNLTASSGVKLACTPNHPILTENGWVPAGELANIYKVRVDAPGMMWAKVYGVSRIGPSSPFMVYNLEVATTHTYIANGVVVHNCHHSAAGTWAKVFGSWPTTRFLGVTATPERLDGKGLGDYYDRMVRGPEVEWLIANGFLSPPRYFAPARMIDASTIRKVAGDYAKNDAAKLFDKPTITGDAVIQYRKICPGKTAVAFAISIAHAVHVAAQFRGSGIPASVIDGTMTDEQRSQCISDLRARRILVLVSCELISEGFDLPAVEAVILLRPTASLALHLQQIGRGLRVSPGKECTFVLDHVGNCLRHGLAEEPRDWSLEGFAARKRKEEESPLKTRRCEKCFAIFNGPVCPSCGAPYETKGREVENVAGDLKQLSPEKLEAIRARKGEERGCKSLEDFQKLGAARNYRPGWAMWRWKNSWRNKPTPA